MEMTDVASQVADMINMLPKREQLLALEFIKRAIDELKRELKRLDVFIMAGDSA